jgi:hypothetical protein
MSAAVILILAASLVVVGGSTSSPTSRSSPMDSTATLTSWNPNIACVPALVTVQNILGSAYPAQALAGSQYQHNSTAGGIPDKRALQPPCTITNIHNQVVSTYVQVNGVYLYSYTFLSGDCSKGYKAVNGGGRYPNNQTFCDNTGDIRAMGTTNGYIHVEFDQDWLAKGYCGSTVSYCNNVTIANYVSTGSVSLDMQGFVYWDENHWELHPLAAWKLTNPPPPPPGDFSIGASPSSLTVTLGSSGSSTITLTSLNGLSGNATLSSSISSSGLVIVWPSVSVSPSSVTLTANGTASSTLTISTSLLTTPGTYTVTVSAVIGSISHSTTVSVTVVVA